MTCSNVNVSVIECQHLPLATGLSVANENNLLLACLTFSFSRANKSFPCIQLLTRIKRAFLRLNHGTRDKKSRWPQLFKKVNCYISGTLTDFWCVTVIAAPRSPRPRDVCQRCIGWSPQMHRLSLDTTADHRGFRRPLLACASLFEGQNS